MLTNATVLLVYVVIIKIPILHHLLTTANVPKRSVFIPIQSLTELEDQRLDRAQALKVLEFMEKRKR